MSETLRGLPATTTVTAQGSVSLDEEVGAFPPAVRLPKENGVPLVWVYNGFVTATLLAVEARYAVLYVAARKDLTKAGNVRAQPLVEYQQDRALDDRWRIDLRTPIGFDFALRWLIDQESAYEAETAPGGLGWPHYPKAVRHLLGRTTDKDRLALARAIETALGPLGGAK